MIKLKQAVIVEGRYDKIKLSSIIDGLILTTDGFQIFKDKQKLELIRKLAQSCGIIIMTDSDSAGFMIRSFLGSSIKDGKVYHAYIPDIYGKESRKTSAGAEGKLGVEGIPKEVIIEALKNAGITETPSNNSRKITKTDLFEDGICGGQNSRQKRGRLIKMLNLPEKISANSLLKVLNIMLTYDEYKEYIDRLE